MANKQALVTVGTSAVLLMAGASNRDLVIIQNNHGSNNLYVGNSAVVATSGLKIAAGKTHQFEGKPAQDTWYGIADGADTNVHIIESGA